MVILNEFDLPGELRSLEILRKLFSRSEEELSVVFHVLNTLPTPSFHITTTRLISRSLSGGGDILTDTDRRQMEHEISNKLSDSVAAGIFPQHGAIAFKSATTF